VGGPEGTGKWGRCANRGLSPTNRCGVVLKSKRKKKGSETENLWVCPNRKKGQSEIGGELHLFQGELSSSKAKRKGPTELRRVREFPIVRANSTKKDSCQLEKGKRKGGNWPASKSKPSAQKRGGREPCNT